MINHASFVDNDSAIKSQFLAGVVLGVPSKKCANFGICRITPMLREHTFSENSTEDKNADECSKRKPIESVVSVLDDNNVEICFLRQSIDRLNYQNHFNTGEFKVEEDYTFDGVASLDIKFQIKKGNYPIRINETLIMVSFKLV